MIRFWVWLNVICDIFDASSFIQQTFIVHILYIDSALGPEVTGMDKIKSLLSCGLLSSEGDYSFL